MTIDIDEEELRVQIVRNLVADRMTAYLRRAFSLQIDELDKLVRELVVETMRTDQFRERLRPIMEAALLNSLPERLKAAVRAIPKRTVTDAMVTILTEQKNLEL